MSVNIKLDALSGTPRLTVYHREHTPANKRQGEVKASATVEFMAYRKGQFSIYANEHVENARGVTVTRPVWITLTPEEAEALRRFMNANQGEG
jgi:hypothetical protein